MNKRNLRIQIAQLSALTAVHFLIDSFAGMPSVLLPEIRTKFALTLPQGVIMIAVLDIACNLVQILTGHMRASKTKPLFLQIGLLLASLISLVAFAPDSAAFYTLNCLFLLAGCGIAIAHPEGLRAIHTLEEIPAPVTTAVFMTGGFLGFSSGGFIASLFAERFGLESITWLLILPVFAILLLYLSKARLAIESDHVKVDGHLPQKDVFSFWSILLMSLPITIASTVMVRLLPSRLDELGFSMKFSGLTVLVYGVGSSIGSLLWASLAHKKGEMKTTVFLLFAGVPFLILHQIFMSSSHAIWLLLGGGFFSSSSYSLIVTLGRNARGLKLGQRMGFVVGGAWGFASLVLMLLSKPAEWYGIGKVLPIVPVGFVASGIIGLFLYLKNKTTLAKNGL